MVNNQKYKESHTFIVGWQKELDYTSCLTYKGYIDGFLDRFECSCSFALQKHILYVRRRRVYK